jgi:hypothetical protein
MVSRTRGGTRTPNLRFWRPLLFQLSYSRIVSARTCDPDRSLGFLVGRSLVTPRAEFLELDASRVFLFILSCAVIPPLAGGAFQRYDISHDVISIFF